MLKGIAIGSSTHGFLKAACSQLQERTEAYTTEQHACLRPPAA